MKLKKLQVTSYKLQAKRGFVALFAILVSSIVLVISFGILNIAIKEVILSSSGRESQFGFYAADAGMECALYWDIKGLSGTGNGIFPTSTDLYSTTPRPSNVYCGVLSDGTTRQDITTDRSANFNNSFFGPIQYIETGTSATTTFFMSIVSGKACSKVEVAKNANSTKIQAYGYNVCDFTNPQVVERAIRATY
ncbi:MAG: hypothetical protein AAB428_01030 [Patescibacteria group bacterium]